MTHFERNFIQFQLKDIYFFLLNLKTLKKFNSVKAWTEFSSFLIATIYSRMLVVFLTVQMRTCVSKKPMKWIRCCSLFISILNFKCSPKYSKLNIHYAYYVRVDFSHDKVFLLKSSCCMSISNHYVHEKWMQKKLLRKKIFVTIVFQNKTKDVLVNCSGPCAQYHVLSFAIKNQSFKIKF